MYTSHLKSQEAWVSSDPRYAEIEEEEKQRASCYVVRFLNEFNELIFKRDFPSRQEAEELVALMGLEEPYKYPTILRMAITAEDIEKAWSTPYTVSSAFVDSDPSILVLKKMGYSKPTYLGSETIAMPDEGVVTYYRATKELKIFNATYNNARYYHKKEYLPEPGMFSLRKDSLRKD